MEDLKQEVVNIPVGDMELEVKLGDFESNTEKVLEIFSTEEVTTLDNEAQQLVFQKMLQFNMKYLEEKRMLEEEI